jgi:hypothetical protein
MEVSALRRPRRAQGHRRGLRATHGQRHDQARSPHVQDNHHGIAGLPHSLAAEKCTHIAMDATGVHWKPIGTS